MIGQGFQPERLRVQPRVGEELVIARIATTEDGAQRLPSVLASDGEGTSSRSVLSVELFEQRVREACERDRLLLVFDQFEELVTLFDEAGAEEARRRLVDLLVRLLRGALPVKVLLSFREDYLGKVKALLSQCPELVDQALRLVPPTSDALPTIIRGPFARYPGQFARELAPTLVDQLVAALGERFGTGEVSLSEVQIVCLRLWQSENPELLLAQKGPQGLLEDYLGEALAGLPQELRPAAIALLGQMITAAGTRNVISAQDLTQRVREQERDVSPVVLENALERLSQSRLVHRERRRDLYLYEIASEFLVPWISRRRAELRRQQERRRERRRLLVLGSIAAVLLVVAAGVTLLALWALHQRSHANREARIAKSAATRGNSLALASDAQAEIGNRPDVSLLLSLAALKPYQAGASAPVEAQNTMVAALEATRRTGVMGILHGHTDAVTGVAFSPDGRTLASGSDDNTVRLWNVATHRQLGAPLRGHTGRVTNVAFSPDGRTLASGSNDDTVRLWNVATHKQIGAPLTDHSNLVDSVAFSPDGRIVALAGSDNAVRLWSVATHKQLSAPLRSSASTIYSMAISPDGRTLALAGSDNAVRLWSVATHKQIGAPLTGHTTPVFSMAFSPDGRTLATGSYDKTVRLWNVATHKQLGASLSGHTGTVADVAFSPDGRTLASASSDKTVRLWSVATHKQLGAPLSGHTGTVADVAFSPDGRMLASASYDKTVRLWSVAIHSQLGTTLRGHKNSVVGVAFSPDGRLLASASGMISGVGSDDNTVRLWNVATQRQVGAPLRSRAGTIYSLAVSPDGRTIASGTSSNVTLWSIVTHRQVGALPARDLVESVAFSPDGRMLASGGYGPSSASTVASQGAVWLWSLATHRPLGTPLRTQGNPVNSVAFSPDGRMLASASSNTVTLWSLATHRPVGAPLEGHTGRVESVAFSPNGRILASAGDDHTVRLWNVADHRQLGAPLRGHTAIVETVAFSPDGRILASGSGDETVRLWSVATHTQLGAPLTGHTSFVFSVAFSPDGRMLASGGDDKTVKLWSGFLWHSYGELRNQVCALVGTGLNPDEWAQYAPDIRYRQSCR